MQLLPAPDQVQSVLSFDFDGTMHHPAEEPSVPESLFSEIHRIRRQYGAVWGINTGRSMEHLIEGLTDAKFPFLPDWIVVRECEIHRPIELGKWIEDESWNHRMHRETESLFQESRDLLDRIRTLVGEHTGAHWMDAEGEPAGLISNTEEEMEWIVSQVEELAKDHPLIAWQRNSIYLRFCHRDYHKGSCLGEVARQHGIPASRCFAIGDSFNDLGMLHRNHAGMIACPGNAVAEITSAVDKCGGYITQAIHGHGATEALRHFFPAQS